MKIAIGAYEAKMKLPELLRQMQAGARFTITNRGKVVADLVPSEAAIHKTPGAAIDKFLAFKKTHLARSHGDIRTLIEEGPE